MRIDWAVAIGACVLAAVFAALWMVGKRERASSSIDVPRKLLVIPVVLVVAFFVALLLAERLGAHWNIHGAGGMLFALAGLAALLAAFVGCIVVPRAVIRMANAPSLRTPSNIAAVVVASLFVVVAVVWMATGLAS